MPQIDLWTYYSVYLTVLIYFLIVSFFTINIILPNLFIIMRLRLEVINYIYKHQYVMTYSYNISLRYTKFLKNYIYRNYKK